jgi:predicted metal-dependent peptidase
MTMTNKSNVPAAMQNKPFMTVPIDDAMEAKAREALILSRMRLLFKHPFFGQLALRLELVSADRSWCPTATTDGKKFYYNPAFILALDDKENVWLVAHELGHCVYEHFLRLAGRDPKLFNIAGDYVINNMLDIELVKKGDYSRMVSVIKPYLDHKYDGWTTEEVYDDLLEQQENGGKPEDEGDLVDVHISLDGSGGEDGDEDSESEGRGAGRPGPLTTDEQKQLQNDLKDALIQAAQAAGLVMFRLICAA